MRTNTNLRGWYFILLMVLLTRLSTTSALLLQRQFLVSRTASIIRPHQQKIRTMLSSSGTSSSPSSDGIQKQQQQQNGFSTTKTTVSSSVANCNGNNDHSDNNVNKDTECNNNITNDSEERPNKRVKTTEEKIIRAKIVSDISKCGERLRKGDLVAFPTETVYGLGCHALDESAIMKVFEAKERPTTDPLIVHVLEFSDASELWNSDDKDVLSTLTSRFWPGPLTLVASAKKTVVPDIIMAGTGFVACRSPSHSVARQLLTEARIPIAAPSANKFGHVSPTRAQHVYDDLKHEDVWILDTNTESSKEKETASCCDVGVESTVAKLLPSDKKLLVLRQGAVGMAEMQQCLRDGGFTDYTVVCKSKNTVAEDIATVAPGQMLRHYSPNIPSYMVAPTTQSNKEKLQRAVVIDYGGKLSCWRDNALQYRDLSPDGNPRDAAKAVFETLRWAERVDTAEVIFFPTIITDSTTEDDGLLLAVQDRLTRAASGQTIDTLDF